MWERGCSAAWRPGARSWNGGTGGSFPTAERAQEPLETVDNNTLLLEMGVRSM